MSYKVAQLTTYFATTDSSYNNINMRTVLGSENFELGAKYNLILRLEMHDIGALLEANQADRFLVSSNMMRFQNYETAVGKLASSNQMVSYASFPMIYIPNICNSFILDDASYCTFTLESEMGFIRVQSQNQNNNTANGIVYPNYLLVFDIYKCS